MSDAAPAFAPVLGHARVLREAAGDPLRRIVADDAGRLDGIAAWEPLFGRHGEGVVAVGDPGARSVVDALFHGLLERAEAEGLVLVRFALVPAQLALATALAAAVPGAVVGPELTVRLG